MRTPLRATHQSTGTEEDSGGEEGWRGFVFLRGGGATSPGPWELVGGGAAALAADPQHYLATTALH